MKKKRIALENKLTLGKSVITRLGNEQESIIVGGDGQTNSYGNAQNCLCWKDPLYTQVCPSTPPQMTCNPGLCQIKVSELSCQAGPGCPAATLVCVSHGTIA